MKFVAITPVEYLEDLKEQTVHMVLAHLTSNTTYAEFYKQRSDDGDFIILDNSIVEIGKALEPKELLRAAMLTGAHEIIIPDDFMNAIGTVSYAKKYIKELRDGFNGRLMGVAHGRTVDEWLWCAKELIKLGVDTIGVPKIMVKMCGSEARYECLLALKSTTNFEGATHLLGVWDNPLEVGFIENMIRRGDIPEVRSCDSVIAYKYAESKLHFPDGERPEGATNFLKASFDMEVSRIHLHNLEHIRKHAGDDMRPIPLSDYTSIYDTKYYPPIKDGNTVHVDFKA